MSQYTTRSKKIHLEHDSQFNAEQILSATKGNDRKRKKNLKNTSDTQSFLTEVEILPSPMKQVEPNDIGHFPPPCSENAEYEQLKNFMGPVSTYNKSNENSDVEDITSSSVCSAEGNFEGTFEHDRDVNSTASNLVNVPIFVPVEVEQADGTVKVLYEYAVSQDRNASPESLQKLHVPLDPNEYIRNLERQRNVDNLATPRKTLCIYNWPMDSDTQQEFQVTEDEFAQIQGDSLMRTQIGHILLAKCGGDSAQLRKICLGKPTVTGHQQMDPEWWALIKGFYSTKYEAQLQSGDRMFQMAFWRGVRCCLEDGLKGKRNHVSTKEAQLSEGSAKRFRVKEIPRKEQNGNQS